LKALLQLRGISWQNKAPEQRKRGRGEQAEQELVAPAGVDKEKTLTPKFPFYVVLAIAALFHRHQRAGRDFDRSSDCTTVTMV
jgi:hypothetical protein